MHRDHQRPHPKLSEGTGQYDHRYLWEIERVARDLRARKKARARARPRAPELRLEEMMILLAAAITLGGPLGALLELCILTLRPAHEIAGMNLEDIDWESGRVRVRSSKRFYGSMFYLSRQARNSILRIAGSVSGRGQAITAGRGPTFTMKQVRIDRLRSQLARVAPATIPIEWGFILLRNSGGSILMNAKAPKSGIYEMAGRKDPYRSKFGFSYATAVAEQWAALIEKPYCDALPLLD